MINTIQPDMKGVSYVLIEERINDTLKRIEAACIRADRNPSEVTLIAVSKTQPLHMIEEAYKLGIRILVRTKYRNWYKNTII